MTAGDIDFLMSRNRLNVENSRARYLSVLICSPTLLRIPCATPEQMKLLNTTGWFVGEAGRVVWRATVAARAGAMGSLE